MPRNPPLSASFVLLLKSFACEATKSSSQREVPQICHVEGDGCLCSACTQSLDNPIVVSWSVSFPVALVFHNVSELLRSCKGCASVHWQSRKTIQICAIFSWAICNLRLNELQNRMQYAHKQSNLSGARCQFIRKALCMHCFVLNLSRIRPCSS